MTQERTVIRANGPFWLYLGVAAVSVIAVIGVLIPEGTRHYLPQLAPIPIALVLGGWVVLGWPHLLVDAHRASARNPFQTIDIPLEEIVGESTRRGLTIETTAGPVRVWAAPPPDRLAAERFHGLGRQSADTRVTGGHDELATSRIPGFPAGDGAAVIAHYRRGADAPQESEIETALDGATSSRGARTSQITRHTNWLNIVIAVAAVVIPVLVARL